MKAVVFTKDNELKLVNDYKLHHELYEKNIY